MILDKLFKLFDTEEERRYQESLIGEYSFDTFKESNKYKIAYENFKSKLEEHEFGKTTSTGENLDAMKKHNISIEDASIIYMYTSHGIHSDINSTLRMHPSYLDKDIEEYCRLLDEALSKMPSFNNKIVYRDIKFPNCSVSDIMEYYNSNVGKIFNENTFLSTHIRKGRWADDEYGVQLTILTNENSNGKDLRELCFNDDEQEVLFKKNTLFKVENVNMESNCAQLTEINTKYKI